jgi:membrane protein implicated in regulation of membrane protease activity
MIEIYGELIATIDPWWFVGFGVIIYLVDFLYTRTDALMCIGLASILQVFPNILELPSNIQAWITPLNVLVAIYGQRWIAKKLRSSKLLPDEGYERYIGNEGKIISIPFENEPKKYFHTTDMIRSKNPEQTQNEVLKRVQLASGEIFPLSAASLEIPCGARVFVVNFNGVEMKVKEEKHG